MNMDPAIFSFEYLKAPALLRMARWITYNLKFKEHSMIKFDMSKHKCQACVICCMDFRIYKDATLHFCLMDQGIEDYDLIAIPGAGKALLGKHAEFVLDSIRISRELHESKEIFLIHHIDCGAYGGSKAFVSKDAEIGKHKYEMEAAKQAIIAKFGSDVSVKKILLDESQGSLNEVVL